MVDGAAGCEREWVVASGPLVRDRPVGRFENRAPVRAERSEVGLCEGCAGDDIVAVVLADIRQRREREVGVEPLGAVGGFVVARPLDSRAAAELVVAESGVVAGTAPCALLPGLEAFLRCRPLHEWLPVLVLQSEAVGIFREDHAVRPGLTRRVDRLLGEMDGAVGIRERACLLAPQRRGEHDIRELRSFRQECIRNDEEQARLGEDRPDPAQVGQRDGRVGAADPQEADGALLGVAEDLHRVRGWPPVRDLLGLDVP